MGTAALNPSYVAGFLIANHGGFFPQAICRLLLRGVERHVLLLFWVECFLIPLSREGRGGSWRCRGLLHSCAKRLLRRMEDELVDALAFAEAHFALGRMHVHVHLFRRQVEEQHEGRVTLVMQDVLI